MLWGLRGQEVPCLSPHTHLHPSTRICQGPPWAWGARLGTSSTSHSAALSTVPLPLLPAWVPLLWAQHWLFREGAHQGLCYDLVPVPYPLLRQQTGQGGRKNGWPLPFPQGQLRGGRPSTGAYSPPRRTYKDQSEQHRGGTSEKRKDREGQRGRQEGRRRNGEG